MKSKISKIFSVAVVLATLASLLVGTTAAPASAAAGTMAFSVISTPSNIGDVLGAKTTAPAIAAGGNVDAVAVSADGNTVFVYDKTGRLLYKSTNAGVTFGTPVAVGAGTFVGLKVSPNYATDSTVVVAETAAVYMSNAGGATGTFGSVANADLTTELESGTITSFDVGNFYSNNKLSILVGVKGDGISMLISNVLKFTYGGYTWDPVGATSTGAGNGYLTKADVGSGANDPNVVAVAFSPNHMSDAEILCVYYLGAANYLGFRYGSLGWNNAAYLSVIFNQSDGATALGAALTGAFFGLPPSYTGGAGIPFVIGTAGGVALTRDVFYCTDSSVTGKGWGASLGASVTSIAASDSLATVWVTKAGSVNVYRTTAITSSTVGLSVAGTKQPTGAAATITYKASKIFVAGSGTDGALSVSTDGGTSYNQLSLIDTGGLIVAGTTIDMTLVSLQAVDANTMFLLMTDASSGNESLFKTTDGGATWQRIAMAAAIVTVAVSPNYATDTTVAYEAGGATIYKSVNGGATFIPVGVPAAATTTIKIGPTGNVYVGAASGFYQVGRWSNATFDVAPGANVKSIAFNTKDATGATIAIGMSNGTVYQSTDNGVTFTEVVGTTVAAPGTGVLVVAYGTDGTLYATDSATALGIYKWTGSNWLQIESTSKNVAMSVSTDGTLYSANLVAVGGSTSTIERCLNPTAVTALGATAAAFGTMNNTNFSSWPTANNMVDLDVVSGTTSNTLYATETATAISTTGGCVGRIYGIVDTFIVAPVISAPTAAQLLSTTGTATLTWAGIDGAPAATTAYAAEVNGASTVAASATIATSGTFTDTTAIGTVAVTGTSGAVTALTSGTTYYSHVRATAPLYSRWSTNVSFTTALSAIGAATVTQFPSIGAVDVSVTPTFVWQASTSTTVTGYEFVIAEDNATQTDKFSIIDTSANTSTNAYRLSETLKYNTMYWWRVRPVSAATKGAWSTFFFTTEAAPVVTTTTAAPPVVITQAATPEITLSIPATTAPVQVIPDYLLWAVIAVGAVLVIAVIVLIVRTRRVS
jgi:hypothetical protein